MPISHTAIIFGIVLTSVQNASTNSGARAAHQRCSAPKVRAGETAVMTFFIRQEINASSDINFVTMTRASAPDHDILICDRKSPLVCKPTSNLYQTDSSIDRNRITLRIPKVTSAFEDRYVLKIYVNGQAEPTDFCYLHVQEERTCPRGTWRCRNGKCISVHWRCDARNDCGDNSDEQQCGEWVCPVDQWKCRDNVCISSIQRCNKRNDCSDGSDEENCDINGEWVCPVGHWKCRDNVCISSIQRCNKRNDCSDGSDEENCDVNEHPWFAPVSRLNKAI
ncbi:sortilin-related receptor-like [Littorina saxatilis]|uniref:sortilin-related receptor-like n=1 Tax=Littorina saxatilis TaxID=31220 RepID=UPI0038B58CB9